MGDTPQRCRTGTTDWDDRLAIEKCHASKNFGNGTRFVALEMHEEMIKMVEVMVPMSTGHVEPHTAG